MDEKYICIELENSKLLNTFVLVSFFCIGNNWMKKYCKVETTYSLWCLGHCNYPWQDELQAILVIFLMRKLLLFIVMVLLLMLLLSVDFIHKRCYFMISLLLFMNMVELFCSWVLLKWYEKLLFLKCEQYSRQRPNDGGQKIGGNDE